MQDSHNIRSAGSGGQAVATGPLNPQAYGGNQSVQACPSDFSGTHLKAEPARAAQSLAHPSQASHPAGSSTLDALLLDGHWRTHSSSAGFWPNAAQHSSSGVALHPFSVGKATLQHHSLSASGAPNDWRGSLANMELPHAEPLRNLAPPFLAVPQPSQSGVRRRASDLLLTMMMSSSDDHLHNMMDSLLHDMSDLANHHWAGSHSHSNHIDHSLQQQQHPAARDGIARFGSTGNSMTSSDMHMAMGQQQPQPGRVARMDTVTGGVGMGGERMLGMPVFNGTPLSSSLALLQPRAGSNTVPPSEQHHSTTISDLPGWLAQAKRQLSPRQHQLPPVPPLGLGMMLMDGSTGSAATREGGSVAVPGGGGGSGVVQPLGQLQSVGSRDKLDVESSVMVPMNAVSTGGSAFGGGLIDMAHMQQQQQQQEQRGGAGAGPGLNKPMPQANIGGVMDDCGVDRRMSRSSSRSTQQALASVAEANTAGRARPSRRPSRQSTKKKPRLKPELAYEDAGGADDDDDSYCPEDDDEDHSEGDGDPQEEDSDAEQDSDQSNNSKRVARGRGRSGRGVGRKSKARDGSGTASRGRPRVASAITSLLPSVPSGTMNGTTTVTTGGSAGSVGIDGDCVAVVATDPNRVGKARSSQYRGVTRHRRSGRWEAHIWIKEIGRQVYLGGYENEEHAAEAYDVAALKTKGTKVRTNFDLDRYDDLLNCMDNISLEELIMAVRRQSQGFSRGSSSYRGVTAHPSGRWESRIGVPGSKHVYLGLFEDEKSAACAYDRALVRLRGTTAATNFALSDYRKELAEFHQAQQAVLLRDSRIEEVMEGGPEFEKWVKHGSAAFPFMAAAMATAQVLTDDNSVPALPVMPGQSPGGAPLTLTGSSVSRPDGGLLAAPQQTFDIPPPSLPRTLSRTGSGVSSRSGPRQSPAQALARTLSPSSAVAAAAVAAAAAVGPHTTAVVAAQPRLPTAASPPAASGPPAASSGLGDHHSHSM